MRHVVVNELTSPLRADPTELRRALRKTVRAMSRLKREAEAAAGKPDLKITVRMR